jgi:hypothetical protein
MKKVLKEYRRTKMLYKKIIFMLVVLCLSTIEIFAGGKDRVGTAGATELLIPVGARGTALGGSSVSMISGVDAIYYNPAGISGSNLAAQAMFSNMTYIADIDVNSFAVAANFAGFGTLALSLKSLSFGDIPVTTETQPDITSETYSPSYLTLGVTYSTSLSDRVRSGITVNFVNETIARVSATGIAFDIGIQYFGLGGINGLKLGIVAKNLGPQMKFDGGGLFKKATVENDDRTISSNMKVDAASFELPSYFELGVGYEAMLQADHKLFLGTSFQNNNYSDDDYKLCMEYTFKDLVYLRGSYQMAPTANTDDYIYGPAFGAGVHYSTSSIDLTLDYAYQWHRTFDASNIITLKIGF